MTKGLDDSTDSAPSSRIVGECYLYLQDHVNLDELLEQKWEKLNLRRIYTKPKECRFGARIYRIAYTNIDDGKIRLLWRTLTNLSLSRASMSSACWGLGTQDVRQALTLNPSRHKFKLTGRYTMEYVAVERRSFPNARSKDSRFNDGEPQAIEYAYPVSLTP